MDWRVLVKCIVYICNLKLQTPLCLVALIGINGKWNDCFRNYSRGYLADMAAKGFDDR